MRENTPPFAATAPLSWFSDRTAAAFKQHFKLPPTVLAAAPGRVNLIGEHVDYNGGWVLPAAIERWIVAAAAPREDDLVSLHDARSGETACFSAAEPGRVPRRQRRAKPPSGRCNFFG